MPNRRCCVSAWSCVDPYVFATQDDHGLSAVSAVWVAGYECGRSTGMHWSHPTQKTQICGVSPLTNAAPAPELLRELRGRVTTDLPALIALPAARCPAADGRSPAGDASSDRTTRMEIQRVVPGQAPGRVLAPDRDRASRTSESGCAHGRFLVYRGSGSRCGRPE